MRSLRPFSNFLRQRSALWAKNHLRHVFSIEAARRWFNDHTSSRNPGIVPNEIEKIRIEFQGAKQSFGNIPAALRKMPKMNPEGIYVNKNLRLDKIQVYGFDYDYTLAHYSKNLQSLTYDLAKEFLVRQLKYPESCLQFQYDPSFPIRGLYFDKMNGCLLKLDFFGSIEPDGCFLGRQKVSRQKIIQIYGSRHIGRDQASGLVRLMDFFCFSEELLRRREIDLTEEALHILLGDVRLLQKGVGRRGLCQSSMVCLIADVVQHFRDAQLEYDASYVYEDVTRAIQHVHGSGILHDTILSDPNKYLMKNNQLPKFLTMLKEKGKKLFLLTNSPYSFVDGGMRFLLEDTGVYRDSWRDLFDVVIACANKPTFYTSEHPFRCYDIEKDTLAFTAVDKLIPGQVYYHGCLKSFLQITKWNGPEVIYFGDHLFSDLRGPSKAGWRTVAIIHELEKEIRIQNTEEYRLQQAKFHITQELLGKFHMAMSRCGEQTCHSLLDELNEERIDCRSMMRNMFNTSFGATFLADSGQESAFSYHIHHYADVYTSKPENFLLYSPEAWLHVPFDIKIMPHHVKVPSSLFKQQ